MFVYLSSLRVYGRETGLITKTTPAKPSDTYGMLHFETEEELWKRRDEEFRVAILRLPPVYGYGYQCEGSWKKVVRVLARHGIFPEYGRRCSMIHMDNLSSSVRSIIYTRKSGIYLPQDKVCASAYEIAREIAGFYGRRLKSTKVLNPLLLLLTERSQELRDIFCGYICSQSMNVPKEWLEVQSLKESVQLTESGWTRLHKH